MPNNNSIVFLENETYDNILKDKEILNRVYEEVFRWEQEDKELAQGRSNFQIEKFIALDNFTIPSTFHSLLKNRRVMAEGLLEKIIEMQEKQKEHEYKWKTADTSEPIRWTTADGGVKLCWYELDVLRLQNYMRSCEIEIRDRVQQIVFFDKLLDRLIELNGKPITKQQFEEEDHVYWERRFANQAMDDILSSRTSINSGNLQSMRRATAPTIISEDIYRIKNPFPDLRKAMTPGEDQTAFLYGLQEKVLEGIKAVTGRNIDDPLRVPNNNDDLAKIENNVENSISPRQLMAQLVPRSNN